MRCLMLVLCIIHLSGQKSDTLEAALMVPDQAKIFAAMLALQIDLTHRALSSLSTC